MSDSVYYGTWINWSRGKVYGSTITLTSRDAGILIAFLAMLVTQAGGSLWRILAFSIHRLRISREPRDGLHYQQLVILRNAPTPGAGFWQLFRLFPSWRKLSDRPFLRSIGLLLLSLINLLAFLAAGILVAEVTKTPGTEVLIRSENCGNWTVKTTKLLDAFITKTLNDTVTASSYARACYAGAPEALECKRYATQRFPYASSEGKDCPFASGMCLVNSPVYILDTGNISSHDHFGINAQAKDRIYYRRKTTCAPIKDKGFITTLNLTDDTDRSFGQFYGQPGDIIDFYNFGPTGSEWRSNFTFSYNRRAASVGYGYNVQASEYNSGDGDNNTWTPHPALIQDDGDLSIVFLSSNDILYYDRVLDPIFLATKDIMPIEDNGENVTLYSSNFFVNPPGCVDQHQFCNPVNYRCTKLDSYSTAVRAAQSQLQLNPMQYVTVSVFSLDLFFSTIAQSIGGRGGSALRAQETVEDLFSRPLPNNQWQVEVEYWFTTGLSKLQQYIVQYATGPTNVLPGTYISKPTDAVSRQLCNNQKIQVPSGSGAISFSTLGVAIIVGLGGFIILISLVLEIVVSTIMPGRSSSYPVIRWALDEKLQLQRMAYEQAGLGVWTDGVQAVPVTKGKQTFGLTLDLDQQHPHLSRTEDKSVADSPRPRRETVQTTADTGADDENHNLEVDESNRFGESTEGDHPSEETQ